MSQKCNKTAGNCEECTYYNVDELTGMYVCSMSLDEDEMYNFLRGRTSDCPYYKYYDEYSLVRKQN